MLAWGGNNQAIRDTSVFQAELQAYVIEKALPHGTDFRDLQPAEQSEILQRAARKVK